MSSVLTAPCSVLLTAAVRRLFKLTQLRSTCGAAGELLNLADGLLTLGRQCEWASQEHP